MGRLRKNKKKEAWLQANRTHYVANPTVYQNEWGLTVFQNPNPIHVEIGCGKGQFITTLAAQNPAVNYVAIDLSATIVAAVLHRIVSWPTNYPFANLKLVVVHANLLPLVFGNQEIQQIYLNFPDPWPKKYQANKRLTHLHYLSMYDRVLANNGQIVLKTDQAALYQFTLQQVVTSPFTVALQTTNLHADKKLKATNVVTEYEQKWLLQQNPIYQINLVKKQHAS